MIFPNSVPIVLFLADATPVKNAALGSLPSGPSKYSSIPTFKVAPAYGVPSGFTTLILYSRPLRSVIAALP